MIDLDGHIVVCHSEKDQAAPTFKHTFGYHPVLAFCDNTGEFLAATLRPGNAGSNTAADTTPDPAASTQRTTDRLSTSRCIRSSVFSLPQPRQVLIDLPRRQIDPGGRVCASAHAGAPLPVLSKGLPVLWIGLFRRHLALQRLRVGTPPSQVEALASLCDVTEPD